MLISHNHKFIFIHVYKVAGTSVRTALQRFTHTPSKKNKLRSLLLLSPSIYNTDFDGHVSASSLKTRLPSKVFDNYFKFAFVRNPWDWQVSLYHFALQTPEHHQHQLIKNMQSFDEYINWRVNEDLRLQKDFLYEEDSLLVNYVGKMENLESDLSAVCKKIGLPIISVPHKNQSKHKSYKEYYGSSTRRYVEEAFAEDIRTFDYSF